MRATPDTTPARRRCTCVRCQTPDAPHGGRGLCTRCHTQCTSNGTLTDWPRLTRSAADFLADYRLLLAEGHTHRQVAERLEYPLPSMRRQLTRLRRRGLLTPAGGAW